MECNDIETLEWKGGGGDLKDPNDSKDPTLRPASKSFSRSANSSYKDGATLPTCKARPLK